ncbi:MAG: hypothetical protein V4615_05130 [Bacteroidota bacterium]
MSSPQELSVALTQEERAVIEKKYAAPVFSKLNNAQLFDAAEILLLKLYVITGWTLPESVMQTILVDQFCKKLQESYGNVNSEEVEYSFRNNTEVQDWGKTMNLSLIDAVMRPYLQQRLEVSRREEVRSIKQLPSTVVETTDAEFIESVKATWLSSDRKVSVIPELAYKVLKTTLALSTEKKDEIRKSIDAGCDPELPQAARNLLCKQLAVARYFENQIKKSV